MSEIKLVSEEKYNFCKGCFFNDRGSDVFDYRCKHKKQIIKGRSVTCGESDSIYKKEKDMNKMPDLKAGMIVNYVSDNYGDYGLYLYINDKWGMSLDGKDRQGINDVKITEIYKIDDDGASSFVGISGKLIKIWSIKSDKDIKIEELQKRMDAISKEMEKLKSNA